MNIKDFWPFRHKKLKQYKYYREWLSSCGYGVMMKYDTIWAESKYMASIIMKPSDMYAYDKKFDSVTKVKEKDLELTDEELSKRYGVPEL